ncbi:plectin-like isoform X2 [Hippocampus comes]|uniref:plectin-like isoform X2 n=1 Tax=Hippocampus comes TaxID=109280 RepID=UPI00094F2AA1|nr:PREDICTED: plectin-like isoform X2 [Hippocampus comes]
MFSFCTSDGGGRGSEGHAKEKGSCKSNSVKSKEMSSQADPSLYSEKQAARPLRISPVSQRLSIADKPEEQAAEKISLLEVLSKAHSARVVPSGRNLTVNDDITLSDDEGRPQPKQKLNKQYIDEMGISEELNEITSSTDAILHEDHQFRAKLDDILRPKDHHGCAEKVTKLKEVKLQSEEMKDGQCVEHKRVQKESELTNLRLSLKQQQEDCLNTIKMAQLNIRELEEGLRQAHMQLSQERCTNAELQQKLKSQDCKQQTMEEDYKRSKHHALDVDLQQAHAQLSQERCTNAQLQQKRKSHDCKEQMMEEDYKRTKHNDEHLRTDLEVAQAHSSTKQKDLIEENEGLNEQLGDIRQDLRPTSDHQAQSVLEWNNMIAGLKCEVTLANVRLAEAEQLRLEMEKALLQEKEEQQRLRKKLAIEKANQQEALTNLTRKLSKAKAYGNSMENELLEREAEYIQAMKEMKAQASLLEERKKELIIASQKQNESQAAVAQEAAPGLELDNFRMEACAKQHANTFDALQTEAQEDARHFDNTEICQEISAEDVPRPTHRETSLTPSNLNSSHSEPPRPLAGDVEVDDDDDYIWSDGSCEAIADGGRAPDQQPAGRQRREWQRESDLFLDLQRCGFQMLERELSTLNTRLQSLQICALPLLTSIDDNLRQIAQSPPSPVRSRWTLRRRWGRSGGEGRRTTGDMDSLIPDE